MVRFERLFEIQVLPILSFVMRYLGFVHFWVGETQLVRHSDYLWNLMKSWGGLKMLPVGRENISHLKSEVNALTMTPLLRPRVLGSRCSVLSHRGEEPVECFFPVVQSEKILLNKKPAGLTANEAR